MSRSFVRGIWGEFDDSEKHLRRRNGISLREKVYRDMKLSLVNPYEPKFRVYVFGSDNYKKVQDMGFEDVKLIDKRPCVWDMKKHIYRHKVEIWNAALKDFDEVVFLDWDCFPVAKIPKNFWKVMSKGPDLQGALYCYKRRKNHWRRKASRTVIAATFLYMRGKDMVPEMIRMWKKYKKPWSEESLLMRYWDETNGGWKGVDYYVDNGFEPIYHTLYSGFQKDTEFLKTRQFLFLHCNQKRVRDIMREGDPKSVKIKLDALHKNRSQQLLIRNG